VPVFVCLRRFLFPSGIQIHRRDAQHFFNRAQVVDGVVLGGDLCVLLHIGARHECDAAGRVHVAAAIPRVVCNHKNQSFNSFFESGGNRLSRQFGGLVEAGADRYARRYSPGETEGRALATGCTHSRSISTATARFSSSTLITTR